MQALDYIKAQQHKAFLLSCQQVQNQSNVTEVIYCAQSL